MSTLTADSRFILVLIYLGWMIFGLVAFALFAPAFFHRAKSAGRRWLVDPVSTMLAGILLFTLGSSIGIGYFLLTMRMANRAEIERLSWWKTHAWATPLFGQGLAVLGIAFLIHSYFLDSTYSVQPWRRVLIHLVVGLFIVLGAVWAELSGLW